MKFFKRKISLCPLIILVFIMFVSCGKNTVDNSVNNPGSNADNNMPGNMGAFTQADLYGEVKSISGNDITLALLEMPQFGAGRQDRSGGQGNNKPATNNENPPTGGQGNNKSATNGENPPTDGNRGNRGAGGGFNFEKKYTGETKTITIASDTTISSFGRRNQDSTQSKLSVADIKIGATIQVWYKKDTGDNKEIERISIMQSMQPGDNANNPSDGNSQQTTIQAGS